MKERGGILRIFVFIKQVPDTGTRIQLQKEGEGIEESGIEWIINPYDEFALEEALRIKERKENTEVVAFSMGPLRVKKALRQALAMGADRACFIEHEGNTWPAKTAHALAGAVRQETKWDLILCGKGGVDENHSVVGQMTAELLNIPHVAFVTKLNQTGSGQVLPFEKGATLENFPSYSQDVKHESSNKISITEGKEGQWLSERNKEEGLKEEITLCLPALITVDKGINQPRYPTLPGIMKAKKKEIQNIDFSSLNVPHLESESLCFKSYRLPAPPPPPHFISGTAQEQAKELVRILKEKQLI